MKQSLNLKHTDKNKTSYKAQDVEKHKSLYNNPIKLKSCSYLNSQSVNDCLKLIAKNGSPEFEKSNIVDTRSKNKAEHEILQSDSEDSFNCEPDIAENTKLNTVFSAS